MYSSLRFLSHSLSRMVITCTQTRLLRKLLEVGLVFVKRYIYLRSNSILGTSVILTSNPRNPTGQVLTNPELAQIQDICRDRATLVMDEFYCGYNYTSDCDGTVVSAADNIEDVDEDGKTCRLVLPFSIS